ncbi:uncharacterized protein LOC126826794 [Patella vulgata]|uniref:uncharacterized protein LOC126826794 n=1 Tax=Patella vulgata TaxID=6465 RepID=UPI0021807496|nr:uncharacterized protein LOC126826794 [Patella vulgata]
MAYYMLVLVYGMVLVSLGMVPTLAILEEFFGLKFGCGIPVQSCVPSNCTESDTSLSAPVAKCMCDEYCVTFGDCCQDYYTKCKTFINSQDILNFIVVKSKISIHEREDNDLISFSKLASCNKVTVGDYPTHIWSIATCNKDYPDGDIKDKCEGRTRAFPLDIPLSVLSTPFMTYQNVYCAVCNYLDLTEGIKYWSAKIKCQVDKEVTLRTIEELRLYPEERCETRLTKPTGVRVRFCDGFVEQPACNSLILQPPDREVRSVSDSGFKVAEEDFNTSGINDKDTVSPDGHAIKKRNAGDNQEVNITNTMERHDNSGHNVTSVNSFQDSVTVKPEIDIQDSENTNSDDLIENNLSLLCDAYHYQYQRDGLWYKNPHCYACQHGWGVFKDTNTTSNEVACYLSGHFGGRSQWPYTKEVNHDFGVYENKFIFYSSDLGTVLDGFPSNCGIAAVYDMISQTCKRTWCPRGSLPYYETCVNTTLYSLYISNINDSTTLYVTINGSTKWIYSRYLDLVQNVVDDLESMDLIKLELDQSSGMVSVNRSIKLTSLELVKESVITEQITTPHGEILIEQSLTLLQLTVTVPILFNDTSQTLHDLMYGEISKHLFSIENMIIRNYEADTTQICPVGILETHNNLAMISIGRHVFVDIKERLVDISKARFTIRKNDNNSWIVASITYCNRDYAVGQTVNSGGNLPRSTSLMCNSTLTLSSEMFDEIGERVRLKTGELIAQSDFVRNGDDLVVCRESLLPEQSLILDRNTQILYKNILTIISIILKLLTFLVSICRTYSVQGGAYFYILALTTSFIDVVHLLENLTNVNVPTILPIMLHFSWLFALYNSMAWCINMISSNSKRTTSCCCRHLVISAVVPIATVVICATGDINDPPWDIGYGSNSHIFCVMPNVVLYGYVLPASAAVVITAFCHIYRIVRRKMYEKDKIFYSCNILVTGLLVVQFTFGCLEGLEDSTVFYYLYFTSAIGVSWTFLAICAILVLNKTRIMSSSVKYLENTNTKSQNVYETAD